MLLQLIQSAPQKPRSTTIVESATNMYVFDIKKIPCPVSSILREHCH